MFVLSIGTALVGAYGLVTRRLRWQTLTGNLRFFLIVGFCVAASTNINYAAVRFIDAGTASMLGKLTTVFALIFGLHMATRKTVARAAPRRGPGDYWAPL